MQSLLALAAVFIIQLLRLTWRAQFHGPLPDSKKGPRIYCFWHGRQAGLLMHPRSRPIVVLVSNSKDGELQSRILSRLGFITVRGSSSRRGVRGLLELIREVQSGSDAAFAVDGPRGPIFKVKRGAVLAAQKSSGQIVPIAARASRHWTFTKAWDRYQLPKPFARIDIYRGDPILVDNRSADELTSLLQSSLTHISGI